jgi:diacylglycerol kinase family enzyme
MTPDEGPPLKRTLTPHAAIATVRAIVNPASGSVDAGAAEALEAILASFGLDHTVTELSPHNLPGQVAEAVAAGPDLLIVLAGDGTARLAAELCGAEGPLVAPLPGGTMNMLPKALYGETDWESALTDTLERGVVRPVSGGEISGKAFYVAAILGSPALWADAREAVRELKLWAAMTRARRACIRAFSGPLKFQLDRGAISETEALTLMCPLVSKALTREDALEAAALDPQGVGEAFRLGLRAAFGDILGDWRRDPAVTVDLCRSGRAWARGRIPAILDGEPLRLNPGVMFHFKPDAFRALAPPLDPPPEPESEVLKDSVKAALDR